MEREVDARGMEEATGPVAAGRPQERWAAARRQGRSAVLFGLGVAVALVAVWLMSVPDSWA